MATLLYLLGTIVVLGIGIPASAVMYERMHEARRSESGAMAALTSIFYTRKPTLVHEQVAPSGFSQKDREIFEESMEASRKEEEKENA